MSNDRKTKALARIAAAMSQLESLSNRPLPAAADAGMADEFAALSARHAKLKEEAALALTALESVIARAANGGQG